jgi:hypothetical protein
MDEYPCLSVQLYPLMTVNPEGGASAGDGGSEQQSEE